MIDLVPVVEARRRVLVNCRRLPPVHVPLPDAVGLVLAEPVRAGEDVPPFANSSMDGYALRAADVAQVPARLRVVAALMAGDDPGAVHVGEGEAVRTMTGAALPQGADAVCMVKHARPGDDGTVIIEEAVGPGSNVRHPGDDITSGDEVFAAGAVLSAAHVGVLASLGARDALVFPLPRVGVISTGDELVQAAGALPPGKIRDSNRFALLAQLSADGCQAVDLGWVEDEPASLAAALREAAGRCDAVLTSGGVSVGDRDIVRTVLGELGGQQAIWLQVAVKPGKPFAFSQLPGGTVVFGLPGNPVSALVSYELFARPAFRRMAGYEGEGLLRPRLRAVCDVDLRHVRDGKLHLVRVVAHVDAGGLFRVRPSGGQGSHQLRALADANALALLPDGLGASAGAAVDVWLLEASWGSSN